MKQEIQSDAGRGEAWRAGEAALSDIVNRVTRRFAPDRIILFGSHARGDAGPGGDIDLLVLFPEVDDSRLRVTELYAVCARCGALKDIVVSTTSRFERYRNVVNTIYWPAAHEGRVVYDGRVDNAA